MTIAGQRVGHLPLRWKLVAMMLGVVVLSLVLLGAGLMLRERQEFDRRTEERLRLLADVIGLNSTAALAFNDARAAKETLAALASDPHVMAGALYDGKGRLFAQYRRADVDVPLPEPTPQARGIMSDGDSIALMRHVKLGDESVGAVYLRADTTEWRKSLWQFAGIVAVLFLLVLTVGLFVSTWLQRIVTEPIADLVGLMNRVGQEGDYTLRATKRADDELGFLVTRFNDMLEEIGKGRVEIEQRRDELRTLNEELEQRVSDRTAQLESANKELEAFSYSVSHDLRAPLRAIDGFSAALAEDCAAQLDAEGQDYLRRVRAGCQRMAHLIDDLLALSRVIRHEMRAETVDLSALARTIAQQLAQADPDRDVRLVIEDDIKVYGDAGLLSIALENLLSNAWKFTRQTPQARIELQASQKDGEQIVCVRDNGAGFDMIYADKLFRPFQRLHDTAVFPGTGIGLATVQRIVHRHGGRIWVEAAVNRGSAFYFTIKEAP